MFRTKALFALLASLAVVPGCTAAKRPMALPEAPPPPLDGASPLPLESWSMSSTCSAAQPTTAKPMHATTAQSFRDIPASSRKYPRSITIEAKSSIEPVARFSISLPRVKL